MTVRSAPDGRCCRCRPSRVPETRPTPRRSMVRLTGPRHAPATIPPSSDTPIPVMASNHDELGSTPAPDRSRHLMDRGAMRVTINAPRPFSAAGGATSFAQCADLIQLGRRTAGQGQSWRSVDKLDTRHAGKGLTIGGSDHLTVLDRFRPGTCTFQQAKDCPVRHARASRSRHRPRQSLRERFHCRAHQASPA